MTEYKNAFLLTDDLSLIEKGRACGVTQFTVATTNPSIFNGISGVTAYKVVHKVEDIEGDKICLASLIDDKTVDAVTEKVLGEKAQLIVFACYSLDEIGEIEARFHLTPVQLLHKLGLLENATVVGGVYLDRDDVDLMAQAGAKLVLCPTCSLGYGYGIAHLIALLGKVEVSVGSGDNAFNGSGDMIEEIKALYLSTCADMREKEVVSLEEIFSLITANPPKNLKKELFG